MTMRIDHKKVKEQLQSPSKLGKLAIQNHTRNIVANIEKKYGKRDTIFYLEASVNVSKKRRITEIRNGDVIEVEVEVEVEVEEQDDDCIDNDEKKVEIRPVLEFMDGERVSNALAAVPEKYYSFSRGSRDRHYSVCSGEGGGSGERAQVCE
jgi:hypothetical protein